MKNDEFCAVKTIEYERSNTIEAQGTRQAIGRYLKEGYLVKEERNGYWILIKKSKVIVTVESSTGTRSVNMKGDILDYYDKKKISEKQVEKFAQDIKKEKVAVCCDANGDCFIKKVKPRKKS
ncbi:MAG: hypothetical protein K0Q77_3049 [Anaerosporomusa subterranea]|jgi:predicted amidohydrolase YtcJ|nr:hypothetical protein [Anaerosporomusa subterranea]